MTKFTAQPGALPRPSEGDSRASETPGRAERVSEIKRPSVSGDPRSRSVFSWGSAITPSFEEVMTWKESRGLGADPPGLQSWPDR